MKGISWLRLYTRSKNLSWLWKVYLDLDCSYAYHMCCAFFWYITQWKWSSVIALLGNLQILREILLDFFDFYCSRLEIHSKIIKFTKYHTLFVSLFIVFTFYALPLNCDDVDKTRKFIGLPSCTLLSTSMTECFLKSRHKVPDNVEVTQLQSYPWIRFSRLRIPSKISHTFVLKLNKSRCSCWSVDKKLTV